MDRPYSKKTVFSWSMYDFANQPFTTLVITFIYGTFFTKVIAENEILGTAQWSRAMTITALIVALFSPIMGAFADKGGYRKVFLMFWTYICIVGSLALYFPVPGEVTKALFWVVVANLGFEMGGVFCNAYLPDIAPKEKIGRVSGYGWSFGYVGGLLAMFLSMVFLVQPKNPAFGFNRLSSSNSTEVYLLNISENKIQVNTSNGLENGMYLKFPTQLKTEPFRIIDINHNQITLSGMDSTNHYKFLKKSDSDFVQTLKNFVGGIIKNDEEKFIEKIQFYGKPSWGGDDIDGSTEFFKIENNIFEIRNPIYKKGEILGISAYGDDGKLIIIDEIKCKELGLDYDLIVKISHSQTENIRATNLLVSIWFLIFSIPVFLGVHEYRKPEKKINIWRESFGQLSDTFKKIKKYRELVKFLIARLIYNDGLITIFSFGGIYAAGTFNFSFEEIMIFGIVLNITAGIGAFALGFLDDLIGGKNTIQVSNVGLIIACLIAVITDDKSMFWLAGILIGVFSGPNQAASRSLMARFIPKKMENEFFGFFAFSGKATAFAGPMLLGVLTQVFQSQRFGVAIVLVFIVIGAFILNSVDEQEGMNAAEHIASD